MMQKFDYAPEYVKFFACFNQQRFFDAHQVLEALWLPRRQGPDGPFYKGLIQLAGAFVHLQKARQGPAVRLFELARENLRLYPANHEGLEIAAVLGLIEKRLHLLRLADPGAPSSASVEAPQLRLQP
jgi:predicted metal-dependent hydrolase